MSLTPPDQDLVGIINQIERDLDEVQFYISGQTTGSGGISIESSTSVPSGGTTGQALVKTSNVDGEVGWSTINVNTVTVGTTTTTASGTNASVINSGTSSNLILDFSIPRGNKGDTGSQGPAGTITLGTVTTTASGTSASVTNVGTASGAILNFSFPRGDKGDQGIQGIQGIQGNAGINAGGPNPIGAIVQYGSATPPSGWLLCNGTAVSRTTYADLFAVVGTTYGAGNGTTTFNLPTVANSIIAYELYTGGTSTGTSSATGARLLFFC